MKKLIFTLLLGTFSGTTFSQTIKIWPGTTMGSGVTFGADVKLTMFRITDNNAVNQKFVDLGMDLVRVPIVAHWGTTDNRYATIKTYVNNAKGKNLNIFASIANSNGLFKANGDLDDGHGADKFPNWLIEEDEEIIEEEELLDDDDDEEEEEFIDEEY